MKTRILKQSTDDGKLLNYRAQRRTWCGLWKNLLLSVSPLGGSVYHSSSLVDAKTAIDDLLLAKSSFRKAEVIDYPPVKS